MVAAAYKAQARLIVTENLKDFRELPAGIDAISPDEFLCGLLEQHRSQVLDLLAEQAADLANPPLTLEELLEGLSQAVPLFAERARR